MYWYVTNDYCLYDSMAQWLCNGLPRNGQWIDGNGVKPELHVLRKGQ